MMDFITLDFETFYDKEYSLSKMTTEEYINDPRFQTIGVGIKFNKHKSHWFPGPMVAAALAKVPWNKVALVAHNARFDASILAWRYGIIPAFTIDTMSMARPFHNSNIGCSLSKLAAHYELGVKGREVVDALGKRLEDFTEAELAQYGEYCKNDCDLTLALLEKLLVRLPVDELRLIDLTLRMYVQPVLRLDEEMVQQEIDLEVMRKASLMQMVDQPTSCFASNDKFAAFLIKLGVEPPMKPSPKKKNPDGTPKMAYAFAKGDADFIALLDHNDPLVSAAIEVRLGVKSTQRESRANRFKGVAERNGGMLPVPLDYYAAHTGRYGGAEAINLQNLQRTARKDPTKGLLRKAICAKAGELLVVEDLSQIEARMLVWMVRQTDRVEAFAQKRDVYSEQATVIYGRAVDRKNVADDFVPGFIGKAVVLGCLAPHTRVLTDSGWKDIVCVTTMDLLWDGEQWVKHRGVVEKGEKPVEAAYGLMATGDHEILTELGWQEWSEVSTNPSLFQSALVLGALPSSTGNSTTAHAAGRRGGSLLSDANVDGKDGSTVTISSLAGRHSAIDALKSAAARLGKNTGGMLRYFQTTRIGSACSTAFQASSRAAIHLIARCSSIMEDGAYLFLMSGAREWQDGERFLRTSSHSPVGTYQNLRSTVSTSTVDMSRGTSGSPLSRKMQKTSGVSPLCKSRSMTYDIAFAGPRNRFTVATDAGPVIVHNCGYGLGFAKFAAMIYVGMLGEKGILFDGSFVQALNVNVDRFITWIESKPEMYAPAMERRPLALTPLVWLTHLACAFSIIVTFRESAPQIVAFWKIAGGALDAMSRGHSYSFGGPDNNLLNVEGNAIILPNGMPIRYEGLEKDDNGDYSFLRRKEGRIQRVKTYGGSVTENIDQALSRIVITDAMLAVDKELAVRIALQVHDEMIAPVPAAEAKEYQKEIRRIMQTPPAWAVGLPLDSEGSIAERYGDAK